MAEFQLNTARGRLLMSLPASTPLFASAEQGRDEAAAEAAAGDRPGEGPGAGFSPGIGTAVAIGVAALLVGSAHLFLRSRRIKFTLNLAGTMVKNGLKALAKDEALDQLRASLGVLERDDPQQLTPTLNSLFACVSHIFASDNMADQDLGQVAPSYLLYEYYGDLGDLRRARAAADAVYHAYVGTSASFKKAAGIHSKLSRGVGRLVSDREWEGVFVRAMHSMVAAQLMYRRSAGARSLAQRIDDLKSAHGMANRAVSAVEYMRNAWVEEQGVRGAKDNPGLRDEITEVVEVGQGLKRSALERVNLLFRPAEALEKNVRLELRRLREGTWSDRGPGGTGSVTFFRGPMQDSRNDGGGPDSAAFSMLTPMPSFAVPPLMAFRPLR
ncbi:MAG: hypothetical protein JXA24_02140 [Proteobacteria bacterium]|nr:hypothetical protein [Pseudomonadota bacterium]